MKKFLTANERLQGFALYTMACQHIEKAYQLERAIAQLFGDENEYNDQVRDAIYGNGPGPGHFDTFDEILANASIKIRPTTKRKSKR